MTAAASESARHIPSMNSKSVTAGSERRTLWLERTPAAVLAIARMFAAGWPESALRTPSLG